MLELRPGCEHCNRPLPPDSTEAMICSFECTFCRDCAESLLSNVCPNCGGGFVPRPIRPKAKLAKNPPGSNVVFKPVDMEKHAAFAAGLKDIPPHQR